jgi:tRNA threonylcarbamoyladenosine biosynthesis protein TsaE
LAREKFQNFETRQKRRRHSSAAETLSGPTPPARQPHDGMTIDLSNLAATDQFGRRLATLLFPGAVVALIGPLGAGKTHLVRAVAEGLGADGRRIASPTFTLIHEYSGRLPIYHFDAYRLAGAAEFAELGADEYLEGEGVCLVEWADRVAAALPAQRLTATMVVTGETSRRALLEAVGAKYDGILSELG